MGRSSRGGEIIGCDGAFGGELGENRKRKTKTLTPALSHKRSCDLLLLRFLALSGEGGKAKTYGSAGGDARFQGVVQATRDRAAAADGFIIPVGDGAYFP